MNKQQLIKIINKDLKDKNWELIKTDNLYEFLIWGRGAGLEIHFKSKTPTGLVKKIIKHYK